MKVLTNNQYYSQIANVIREQNGTSNTYTPPQMVSALKDLFYEEVEGVPPISFNGIGENLLDYRIYGAIGGVGDKTNNLFDGIFLHRSVIGNEVGTDGVNRRSIAIDISNYNNGEKITFSRETAVGSVFQMYQISSTQTGGKLNNENVISGNSNTLLATITITNVNEYPYLMIFLNGENNPIEDEELIASKIMINVGSTALPYEPYGYKLPVVISGKNLFNSTIENNYHLNQTTGLPIYGANRCATINPILINNNSLILQYKSEVENTLFMYSLFSDDTFIRRVAGNASGATIDTTGANKIYFSFYALNGTVKSNNLSEIMLSENNIVYEPYHEPTITNIYLDEPIGENESISLSDTNVNIPTISGTNVLTVDTTVQPSKVYIKVGGG